MHRLCFNVQQWLPSKHQWLSACESIQEGERKRISEFVFKDDAKSSLMGRVLLRYAICQLSGVPWDRIVLKRSSKGKPIIDYVKSSKTLEENFPRFAVNVSHSGDFVIAVADKTQLVGVDIMDIRSKQGDVSQFFGVMKRNFTAKEWDHINRQCNDEGKMKSFYRHWCLKESFVKAIGKGIGYSLQKLSFEVDPDHDIQPGVIYNGTKLEIDEHQVNHWFFEETMIDCNHCVAVATDITNHDNASDIASINETFTEVHFNDIQDNLLSMSPTSDELWTNFQQKLTKNRV